MRPNYHSDSLRTSAAKHLWMPNRDWSSMPGQNNPTIVVDGNGIKVLSQENIKLKVSDIDYGKGLERRVGTGGRQLSGG